MGACFNSDDNFGIHTSVISVHFGKNGSKHFESSFLLDKLRGAHFLNRAKLSCGEKAFARIQK